MNENETLMGRDSGEREGQSEQQSTMPDAVVHIETRDGLPVLSGEEYDRLYHTDIRAFGAEHAVTFDFQGYVKEERKERVRGLFYRDVFATNGLFRNDTHQGIHIGIDGVVNYDEALATGGPLDSTEVGEYDAYIIIPPALQKEKGCFCRNDKCYPLSKWDDEIDGNLDEFYARSEPEFVAMRLPFYPAEDPLARKKVAFINAAIISHIEQGGELYDIQKIVYDLEEKLENITLESLESKAKQLQI